MGIVSRMLPELLSAQNGRLVLFCSGNYTSTICNSSIEWTSQDRNIKRLLRVSETFYMGQMRKCTRLGLVMHQDYLIPENDQSKSQADGSDGSDGVVMIFSKVSEFRFNTDWLASA